MVNEEHAQKMAKAMNLKELRMQCRARGITPAGGREALAERLVENMLTTGDFDLKADPETGVLLKLPGFDAPSGSSNNYSRPDGQNVGNFMTDRPTSRVLAPPGGGSNVCLGTDEEAAPAARAAPAAEHPRAAPASLHPAVEAKVSVGAVPGGGLDLGKGGNNYSRPGGQNVGNFITDKPTSKVLAPPGGSSSVFFG